MITVPMHTEKEEGLNEKCSSIFEKGYVWPYKQKRQNNLYLTSADRVQVIGELDL